MKRFKTLIFSLIICINCISCGQKTSYGSDVDYDLTAMSSTMVYAEVSNMLTNADDYKGKTIRMHGDSNTTHGSTHSCIVYDALGCCTNGIEYMLNEDKYDEYPDDGKSITVVGTFATYKKGESKYFVLINAEIE